MKSLFLLFAPGVFQRDGTVEYRQAVGGVRVDGRGRMLEVPEILEIIRREI